MSTLAVAAGAASQARRLTPPPTQAQPATTRSSYPNHTSDLSSSTATTRPSSPPHHERSRNNNRPTSAPAMRTSITALPTIGTCLHKLPYLSPEDAQPLIAHNSSPRSDEGVRESMVCFTTLFYLIFWCFTNRTVFFRVSHVALKVIRCASDHSKSEAELTRKFLSPRRRPRRFSSYTYAGIVHECRTTSDRMYCVQ